MLTDGGFGDLTLAQHRAIQAMPKWPRTVQAVNRLPSVPLAEIRALPQWSGLYFVTAESARVVYVGCTGNLWRRWRPHHHIRRLREMADVRVAWIGVLYGPILWRAEDAAIRQFWPELNVETRWYGGHNHPAHKPRWPTMRWLHFLLRKNPAAITYIYSG